MGAMSAELWIHEKDCECVRCKGFQPGHKINLGRSSTNTLTHGAHKSPLVLQPEAEKIEEIVRPLLPVPYAGFEGTLQSYCITLTRIQKAHDALEEVERKLEEDPDFKPAFNPITLGDYLMRWQNSARKDAAALGLTPESAAKILKDSALGNLASSLTVTKDQASRLPIPALERLRAAMLEALEAEQDVIDT